ncbi:hypothetical protein DFJ58DRAFT_794590, partial [Suillus subalutaceus]|uniref:uncharacterized protein n=1 Tax=Suillus subalutaceus TaxID=48586 RepID=UPI001B8680F3
NNIQHTKVSRVRTIFSAIAFAVVTAKLASPISATPQIDPTKKCPTRCYTQSACKQCPPWQNGIYHCRQPCC